MKAFTIVTAPAAPMPVANIDTDQIIPARFLRKPRKEGYGGFLFHDMRFDAEGREQPDFVLNQAAFRGAPMLVAGANFGCGSSREGAVYALMDGGVRVVIAPSFGDIFFNNSLKNGLLPVRLPDAEVKRLLALIADPAADRTVTVDLAQLQVTFPDGTQRAFEIEPFRRRCLLEGLDDIGFTRQHTAAIDTFEQRRLAAQPWLAR